jgi:hypothetical protein
MKIVGPNPNVFPTRREPRGRNSVQAKTRQQYCADTRAPTRHDGAKSWITSQVRNARY